MNATAARLAALALISAVSATNVTAFAQTDAVAETAVEVVDPEAFVDSLVGELRTLAEAKATGETVDLQAVFSRELDTKRMQRQLLSRESRKVATRDEFDVYRELFPTYIATVYADSIDELVSRTIEVEGHRERGKSGSGDFIVRSRLYDKKGKARARIDWRVLYRENQLRLVDVLVEGQSVNIERRAQFTAIVKNDGFSALIDHMRDQLGQPTPS